MNFKGIFLLSVILIIRLTEIYFSEIQFQFIDILTREFFLPKNFKKV